MERSHLREDSDVEGACAGREVSVAPLPLTRRVEHKAALGLESKHKH